MRCVNIEIIYFLIYLFENECVAFGITKCLQLLIIRFIFIVLNGLSVMYIYTVVSNF